MAHLGLAEDPGARMLTYSVEGVRHTAGVPGVLYKALTQSAVGHLKEIKGSDFPPRETVF